MSVYCYLYRPTATSVDTTTTIANINRVIPNYRPSSNRGSTEISTVSRPTYRPLLSIKAPYKTQDPLCADNFSRLFRFCFGLTALLDEFGLSFRVVFLIMTTDYKIDVQQTQQIFNKKVMELITLPNASMCKTAKKIFTGGNRKKKVKCKLIC